MPSEKEIKWTLEKIKKYQKKAGWNWFLIFQKSYKDLWVSKKIHQGGGGVFFVTSKGNPRVYNVREFYTDTYMIFTPRDEVPGRVNSLAAFSTAQKAQHAAAKLARG